MAEQTTNSTEHLTHNEGEVRNDSGEASALLKRWQESDDHAGWEAYGVYRSGMAGEHAENPLEGMDMEVANWMDTVSREYTGQRTDMQEDENYLWTRMGDAMQATNLEDRVAIWAEIRQAVREHDYPGGNDAYDLLEAIYEARGGVLPENEGLEPENEGERALLNAIDDAAGWEANREDENVESEISADQVGGGTEEVDDTESETGEEAIEVVDDNDSETKENSDEGEEDQSADEDQTESVENSADKSDAGVSSDKDETDEGMAEAESSDEDESETENEEDDLSNEERVKRDVAAMSVDEVREVLLTYAEMSDDELNEMEPDSVLSLMQQELLARTADFRREGNNEWDQADYEKQWYERRGAAEEERKRLEEESDESMDDEEEKAESTPTEEDKERARALLEAYRRGVAEVRRLENRPEGLPEDQLQRRMGEIDALMHDAAANQNLGDRQEWIAARYREVVARFIELDQADLEDDETAEDREARLMDLEIQRQAWQDALDAETRDRLDTVTVNASVVDEVEYYEEDTHTVDEEVRHFIRRSEMRVGLESPTEEDSLAREAITEMMAVEDEDLDTAEREMRREAVMNLERAGIMYDFLGGYEQFQKMQNKEQRKWRKRALGYWNDRRVEAFEELEALGISAEEMDELVSEEMQRELHEEITTDDTLLDRELRDAQEREEEWEREGRDRGEPMPSSEKLKLPGVTNAVKLRMLNEESHWMVKDRIGDEKFTELVDAVQNVFGGADMLELGLMAASRSAQLYSQEKPSDVSDEAWNVQRMQAEMLQVALFEVQARNTVDMDADLPSPEALAAEEYELATRIDRGVATEDEQRRYGQLGDLKMVRRYDNQDDYRRALRAETERRYPNQEVDFFPEDMRDEVAEFGNTFDADLARDRIDALIPNLDVMRRQLEAMWDVENVSEREAGLPVLEEMVNQIKQLEDAKNDYMEFSEGYIDLDQMRQRMIYAGLGVGAYLGVRTYVALRYKLLYHFLVPLKGIQDGLRA